MEPKLYITYYVIFKETINDFVFFLKNNINTIVTRLVTFTFYLQLEY